VGEVSLSTEEIADRRDAVLARIARAAERVRRDPAGVALLAVTKSHPLELVRRAANRRLAAMVKEIAALRHHEARAQALERMLATRPTEGTPDGEDSRLPG